MHVIAFKFYAWVRLAVILCTRPTDPVQNDHTGQSNQSLGDSWEQSVSPSESMPLTDMAIMNVFCDCLSLKSFAMFMSYRWTEVWRAIQITFLKILNLVARKLYKPLSLHVDCVYNDVTSLFSEHCGFHENP